MDRLDQDLSGIVDADRRIEAVVLPELSSAVSRLNIVPLRYTKAI